MCVCVYVCEEALRLNLQEALRLTLHMHVQCMQELKSDLDLKSKIAPTAQFTERCHIHKGKA